MRKRLFPFAVLYCLILLLSACVKHDSAGNITPEENLIAEAKNHFIFDVSITEGAGAAKTGNKHHYMQKTPVWEKATVEKLNSITTVVVPVYFSDSTLNVRLSAKDPKRSANDIGYMLIFRNPKRNNELTTEVLYLIPDKSATETKFSGVSMIEQWDGTILRGYQHSGESVSRLSLEMAPPTMFARGAVCETIDWYTCVTVGSSNEYCNYTNSTTKCLDLPDEGGTSPSPSTGNPGGDPGGGVPAGGSGRVVTGGDRATRPTRVPNEPLGALQICPESFKFIKVISVGSEGIGGWQVASVKGLHMLLLDSEGKIMLVSPGPTIYFSLPIIRQNGDFYSTARAAELAQEIDNAALQDVMDEYHSGLPITWKGMNAKYLKALGDRAKKYGGKVGLTPGLGNIMLTLPPPTTAKYSGVFGFNCN